MRSVICTTGKLENNGTRIKIKYIESLAKQMATVVANAKNILLGVLQMKDVRWESFGWKTKYKADKSIHMCDIKRLIVQYGPIKTSLVADICRVYAEYFLTSS